MCTGPAVKLAIGLLLVFSGIYAILPGNYFSPIAGISQGFAWEEFKTVVIGIIPPLAVLIGFLIIWIELEEIKIEREEKRIEAESKKKRTKRKKK